jgi:ParB-like chromosome segregation protein Spo0J
MTRHIPLELLRFQPNMPAGMNPLVLMSLAYALRSSVADVDPILVQPHGDGWLVLDGRHRTMAHWIAGRSTALCVEDTDGS